MGRVVEAAYVTASCVAMVVGTLALAMALSGADPERPMLPARDIATPVDWPTIIPFLPSPEGYPRATPAVAQTKTAPRGIWVVHGASVDHQSWMRAGRPIVVANPCYGILRPPECLPVSSPVSVGGQK